MCTEIRSFTKPATIQERRLHTIIAALDNGMFKDSEHGQAAYSRFLEEVTAEVELEVYDATGSLPECPAKVGHAPRLASSKGHHSWQEGTMHRA